MCSNQSAGVVVAGDGHYRHAGVVGEVDEPVEYQTDRFGGDVRLFVEQVPRSQHQVYSVFLDQVDHLPDRGVQFPGAGDGAPEAFPGVPVGRVQNFHAAAVRCRWRSILRV